MEAVGTEPSGDSTPSSSPRGPSLSWRIARYLLLVIISAALSEILHVEFVHKVSDKFMSYASQVQPLALAGDFFSVVTTGEEPEVQHPSFGSRTLAERAEDLAQSSKRLQSPSLGSGGSLMQIPHATWYVLKKSFSQGWVSFAIIVTSILLAYRAAIRNTEDGDLTRIYRIAIAPLVGIAMMALLMLFAVGVAALTTTVVSFFSIIFSPAVLTGSLKEERIHSLTERIAHKLPHHPDNPRA